MGNRLPHGLGGSGHWLGMLSGHKGHGQRLTTRRRLYEPAIRPVLVRGKHLFFVTRRIVLLQQVFSEVAAEVPPNGVDVVGVVLRVVELDQE